MELWRWIQVLCIMPVLQDFFDYRVRSMQCFENQYLTTEQGPERCCEKCPAGKRVDRHCLAGRTATTKCISCEEGSTYQPEPNGETSCRRCEVQYKANRKVIQRCTTVHNKEYGDCEDGFYLNTYLDSCRKCSRCPPGYGVKQECTTVSDTVCDEKQCEMGTYSDQKSSTQKCMNCSECSGNEEISKECTPYSNRECVNINITPTRPVANEQTITANTLDSGRAAEHRWAMPLFISVMVLVLVIFLAFVVGVTIWCHIQSRNRQLNHAIVQAEATEVVQRLTRTADDVEAVYSRNETTFQWPALTVKTLGGVQENGMMIRDVSHDVIEELANFLNPTCPPTNWRKVASTLHFPWSVISNMALSPTNATQQLLERWGTKRDATVFKLYEILKEIGRDDAAEVLERLLLQPVPSCPKSV